MNGRFKKRYIFLPVIYTLVTVFIFSLYFGGSRSFSRPWGAASFTGRTGESGFGRDRSLALELGGMTIPFGRGLRFLGVDGTEQNFAAGGFTLRGSDVALVFGDDLTLDGVHRNGLFVLEGTVDGPGVLEVPIRLPETADAPLAGVPLLRIAPTTYLRLPTGTLIENEVLALTVPAEGTVRMDILVGDERDPMAIWLAQGTAPPTSTETAAAIADWTDAAYAGWERTRYQGGRWSFPGSSTRFDEMTAMAFLVESMERGNGSLASTRMEQILTNRPQGLGYATSPFFDEIVSNHNDASRLFSSRAESLRNSITDGDLDALAASDLLDILIREPALRRQITSAVRSEGYQALETATIVNLFEVFSSYLDGGFSTEFSLDGSPTEALLSRIAVSRDGYFLRDDRGEIDLVTSLRAGRVILDFETDPTYRGLGRGLVAYALGFADDAGFLPPNPGKAPDVAPASIYPYVSPSDYWPMYRFVYDGPQGELWIRGSLADTVIDARSGFVSLSFSYPIGIAHYFAVENVPPIAQVTLYGLAWNRDFRFQRFTAGWDESGGTVFAKIRHRIATERFVIQY